MGEVERVLHEVEHSCWKLWLPELVAPAALVEAGGAAQDEVVLRYLAGARRDRTGAGAPLQGDWLGGR